jgi:hypothetical protein
LSAAPGFAFAVVGINHGRTYGQVQLMPGHRGAAP